MPDDSADQPIHEAASDGDLEQLSALLDEEPGLVNAPGWFGRTPLHCAAGLGWVECVSLLVERGADVNARDGLHSETPLFAAVQSQRRDVPAEEALACARLLLERGADPNARDTHRRQTPLFEASSLEMLHLLEEHGADFDVVSDDDQYPFEVHAYAADFRLLRFWVERGVDVNHVPAFQVPALLAVVPGDADNTREEHEKVEQLRWLLERGADPDIRERSFGRTALHFASSAGMESVARALIDGGADPSAPDHGGQTPLHDAARAGHAALVRLLVERGADPSARDSFGTSALKLGEEYPEVVEILGPLTDELEPTRAEPEELVARLTSPPQPCSEEDIERLESTFGVRLPESYRKFLRLMGRGPRRFLESDHWSAFYPDLLRMGQGAAYEESCEDLPANYFVFASRFGYYLFFVADGRDDDPPVYRCGAGFSRRPEKLYDSFWDFIAEMITYDEVTRKRSL